MDAYIRGLNETLYDKYDEARFRWKMQNTPFSLGFISIAVVEHAGKPVAFNSFLPLRVRFGSDINPIVQGCDGFVEPSHRRMGLFQETLKFMKLEFECREPKFLMGFNFAGSTNAAKKAGSTITSDVHALAAKTLELKKVYFEGEEDIEVEPCSLNEIHRIYEDWAATANKLHYERAKEYLRWRYSHPIRCSSFYRIRNGSEVGYAVASLEHENEAMYNIFLEDYTPILNQSKVASAFIKNLLEVEQPLNEVYLTATTCSPISRTAQLLGFKPDHVYTLIFKNIQGLEEREGKLFRDSVEVTKVEDWHIVSSDVF